MLSQPFILQLPRELCDQLLEEYQLSRKDIGSLRRTCKAFATIAGPVLLCERVILSRLEEDRAKFKNVVKYHGRHVREVIWQGLNLQNWRHINWRDNPASCDYLEDEAHSDVLAANVMQNTDLLWIPPQYYPDPTVGKIWQAATNWISKQVDDMPNMTTLTIKPMPYIRAFGRETKEGHRFWAQYPVVGSTDFDFVIPLMALRRPSCRVRTLNLDTRFGKMNILEVQMQDMDAFQYLTTINICFGPVKSRDYTASRPLLACIKRSENLRNLKLCFADTSSKEKHDPDLFLRGLICHRGSSRLRSLHIVNTSSFLAPRAYSGWLSGLRHLTLDDCDVTSSVLHWFRLHRYYTQLESITIRARPVDSRRFFRYLVPSATVLAFIKRDVEDLGPGIIYETPGELITDTPMPQCHLCSRPEKME
ncbi:hypothetical protein F4860DRAFT_524137 [Xylaria cubensis]|nr:hypothetical protein F4860DRAFT_524137 [Xylaria cubensis]